MTTKKNFVFAFISLFAMLLTALGISFAFPSQKADSAIDWTGHSYTKFTPYSTTDGVYLSPIEDNARLGFVVVVVGGYSLIGGSYNGFMTTSAGATCGIDGTTYEGAQHQGTNTNYYDIRYRIEAYAQSNVYIRQARVAAKNASGFYALYTDTDYGINSTTTSFKYGQTIDRDDTFGTVEGSGAYDINMLYDLVLVYEYFINGNSVRVSAGSVADELAGGLGAATTVNPADYERDGYALEGFWTGENKTGTQVLDADGYFVNDYAYTPGATLYPGYTNIIYWTDETAWSSVGQDFNNYSWQGSGTEEDPYLIRSEWDLAYLSWTIYNADEYGVTSSDLYYYDGKYFLQTKDLNFEGYYWQPIGIYYTRDASSAPRYFSGNYDGGSCTISGINTPPVQSDVTLSNSFSYQGLFGYVYANNVSLTIKNLGIENSFIQGYDYVGGIVGFAEAGEAEITINYVYNAGSVSGKTDIGGIIGRTTGKMTISNVYNTGSVSGAYFDVGGIAGRTSSTIINAYNAGSVSGEDYIGGIVGNGSSSNINNAYNTGVITGTDYGVGGLIGIIFTHYEYTINNSYNTGSVNGGSSVGGIVGSSNGGNISNIYNTGSINGSREGSSEIGGILGSSQYDNMINTFNMGTVNGGGSIGGIIGYCNRGSFISNIYNIGVVSGNNNVGGIIGRVWLTVSSRNPVIVNLYNLGTVTGVDYVGGIIGQIRLEVNRYSVTISNTYNTGAIVGNNSLGGIVGDISDESGGNIYINNSYFGGNCTLSDGVGSFTSVATITKVEKIDNIVSLAKTEEWYSADAVLEDGTLVWNEEYPWDFESVWAIYGETVNEGYPVFIRYWTDIYYTFDNYVFSGAGTQADPYLIETPQQLAYLSWTIYSGSAHNGQSITINGENYYYQNSCFRQTANIDLSAGYWQPIGIFSTRESSEIVNRYFAGKYDGNGYIITGINIPEDTEYSYQGLFGVVKGNITDASVTNVAIYNSNIHGLEYVGGIAGYVGANASVTNSFYQGGVYGSSSGGIVGQVEGGEVSSSGFEGDVSAGVSAIAGVISNGGLVDSSYGIAEAPAQSGIAMYGQIDGGTIQNSLSICHDGDVTSKNYIGSDFSEFVWLNTDSSPIPRSLTWIGSIWPGSVTVDMLSSSGWTEIVA